MPKKEYKMARFKRKLKSYGYDFKVVIVPNTHGILIEDGILAIGEKYWKWKNTIQLIHRVWREVNDVPPKPKKPKVEKFKPQEISIISPSSLDKPDRLEQAKHILNKQGFNVFSDKNCYYLNGFPVTIQTIIQKAGLC